MDAIAEAVRVGFVRTHESRPLESFREAVIRSQSNAKAKGRLLDLPPRGTFEVRRVLDSEYFFC